MTISVVIPLYNKEKQIAKTLRSVLGQTFQDFEIVVVNDGSTDGSENVVRAIDDPRIRLINQENAGVSAARNRGIKEAKGEYIAFLDADDEWDSDYLEMINYMLTKYPECDVFGTAYRFRDEYGNSHRMVLNGFHTHEGIMASYFHIASISDSPLWTSAVVATKNALQVTNGFPEGVCSGEDLLAWARLAAQYKIAYLNEPKAVYFTPTTGPTGKVPPDLTTTHDAVGMELIQLAHQFKNESINEYVSFWYKMRASINLHRFNRGAAFRCSLKAVRYNPLNYKAMVLALMTAMPQFVIKKVLGR